MDETDTPAIWLNYVCAADDSIRWRLQYNRRFSIFGLESGHIIELIDAVGRKLFSMITAENEHSVTISGVNNGCIVLSIEDRYRNILKQNYISPSDAC